MNKQLKEIEFLIEELPIKDRLLCNNFLKERNFQSLLEIVQADIKLGLRHNRLFRFEKPYEEKYKTLNIDMLRLLEVNILLYTKDLLTPGTVATDDWLIYG